MSSAVLTPPHRPRPVRPTWWDVTPRARQVALSLHSSAAPTDERFTPELVADLPEPARRWLTHAIAVGTPLLRAAELQMHGVIRLGQWRQFTATEAIVPDAGFVWAARTRIAGLPVQGFDSYADGRGLMHWRVSGAIPVQSSSGFDVAVSAAHRLAAESVLVPTALVHATWHEAPDADSAVFEHALPDLHGLARVTVRVGDDGRLAGVSMRRWGKPEGDHEYGSHRFDVEFDGEYSADGLRIGDGIRAAWFDESGRRTEFFRAWMDSAAFLLAVRTS